MENALLFKFLSEVRQQCRFGLFAQGQLRTSLPGLDQEAMFYHAHGMLFHAMQVSRLLWPESTESAPRGERLRSELKVADESPLKLRGLRRRIERADEQFEDWLAEQGSRAYVELNVMPAGAISDFKPDTFHRSLDPETLVFHFRGDAWDLRRIGQEFHRLETAADVWMKTHRPW